MFNLYLTQKKDELKSKKRKWSELIRGDGKEQSTNESNDSSSLNESISDISLQISKIE